MIEHLPLAPLMEAMGIKYAEPGFSKDDFDGNRGMGAFAEKAGITRRTAFRWAKNGIPVKRMEHLATKVAGVHPMNIWPDEYQEISS